MSILTSEGALMAARWVHFMAGITWIGLLYYFNFIQGSFFNEIDAQTKNVAIQKLVPRALWWFRMGALWTFIAGAYILLTRGHLGGFAIYETSWGTNILVGALMGTLMFLNVWLIIWPNQKVVIANANAVLSGQAANPQAAACGARATVASRTNTLFSIPMLLFMGMASHFSYSVNESNLKIFWVIILVLIGAIEINAIKGKTGPMTTVKGVITSGFVLAAVLFLVVRLVVAIY